MKVLAMTNRFASFSATHKRVGEEHAFTLLEVMVAVAILAIVFTTLFGSQSRSLSSGTEAIFNTHAPLLASLKLAELDAGVISLSDTGGDFGEDFPGYSWELFSEEVSLGDFGFAFDSDVTLQKIRVEVSWGASANYRYSLAYYGQNKE